MHSLLIVGLGNPGQAYQRTRHTIGFLVVDALAEQAGARFHKDTKRQALLADLPQAEGMRWLLAKPQTFMNESGRAVAGLARLHHLKPENIWTISDDVDLPFGRLRLRHDGSSGGHQGLQSVIDHLPSDAFHRLRIGIGSNREKNLPAEDYVLQPFTLSERQRLPEIVDQALTVLAGAIAQTKNVERATDEE